MATKEARLKQSVKGTTAGRYFGVTKSSGKSEIYNASCRGKGKGFPVYVGSFVSEEEAARAHDIIALKYKGSDTNVNFPISDYEEIEKLMKDMSRERVLASVRRCGSRFARATGSNYRGVSRKPKDEKWMAAKGVKGELLYLGYYETPEKAAIAYDVHAIKVKGWVAMTNFNIELYNVEAILAERSNQTSEGDKARFVKKELLDAPQNFRKVRGHQFLEQIEDMLRGHEKNGPSATSKSISSQPLNSDQNQLSDSAVAEECGNQIGQKLQEFPPFHFPPEAGSKFRHSGSSCFKPYKRPKLV